MLVVVVLVAAWHCLFNFDNSLVADDIERGFGIDIALGQLTANHARFKLPDALLMCLKLIEVFLPSPVPLVQLELSETATAFSFTFCGFSGSLLFSQLGLEFRLSRSSLFGLTQRSRCMDFHRGDDWMRERAAFESKLSEIVAKRDGIGQVCLEPLDVCHLSSWLRPRLDVRDVHRKQRVRHGLDSL